VIWVEVRNRIGRIERIGIEIENRIGGIGIEIENENKIENEIGNENKTVEEGEFEVKRKRSWE